MVRSRVWAIGAALLLATLLCYLPAARYEFLATWDDGPNLLLNERWRELTAANLRWMTLETFFGHWHPLTWLSFWLNFQLGGLDPSGYHLANALLHAATAVVFYLLLRRLLRLGLGSPAPEWASALAALFFAVHPLRVESVAWITERRDVLSGLLLVTATHCWLRAVTEGPRRRWLALALAAYAGSLLSKAWGITLPVVLLVLDLWPLRRSWRDSWREKVPFALLALVAALIAAQAQRSAGAAASYADWTFPERCMQAAFGLAHYALQTFVPLWLCPLHEHYRGIDVFTARHWLALLALAGVTLALLAARARAPGLLVAWAIFLVLASPVLGFLQSGPQLFADRYTYLACLPFAALVAAAATRCRADAAIATVLVAACAVLTWRQLPHWRNDETLWSAVLGCDPESSVGNYNLGHLRLRAERWAEAEPLLRKSLIRAPGDPTTWSDLGLARAAQGHPEEALAIWRGVLQAHPQHPVATGYVDQLRARRPDLFK
jgi:tetratricopeptide (TPR) repeat protein